MLLVLGLNYRTAPLELRERLTVDAAALPAALDELNRRVAPGVILSTCNRLEVYTLAADKGGAAAAGEDLPGRLRDFVADYWGVPAAELRPYCYDYSERECVRHLFRVASGLDSMVVGEWEILGQVRAAFSAASERGYVRGPLSRLFHQALRAGRRVHHAAELDLRVMGSRRRSVSLVGVQLAHRLLGDLAERRVLIIGAGDAGQLTGRALAAAGAENLVVTNRTYDRAERLSGELGGTAAPFEQLYQTLAESDAVISTTASPDYLLRREPVAEVMELRGGRPLLLIDIAVPRDIEPAVGLLEGVRLCDIDALRADSEADNAILKPAAARAEELVAEETGKFWEWWESLDTISAIAALRKGAETIRRAEVEKTLRRMQRRQSGGAADSAAATDGDEASGEGPGLEELAAQLDALTGALVKKLLHSPTAYLRAAKDPLRQQLIGEVFDLEGDGGRDGRRR